MVRQRWLRCLCRCARQPCTAEAAGSHCLCAACAPLPLSHLPVLCHLPAPRSKTLIGDYLGERDDFNLRVMHCYVDALEFTDQDFDEAIRCGEEALGLALGRRWSAWCLEAQEFWCCLCCSPGHPA